MGVGVCFGNGCNRGHIDDNPEIDASGREAVRLRATAATHPMPNVAPEPVVRT
jgi:hypothetical protein